MRTMVAPRRMPARVGGVVARIPVRRLRHARTGQVLRPRSRTPLVLLGTVHRTVAIAASRIAHGRRFPHDRSPALGKSPGSVARYSRSRMPRANAAFDLGS